MCQRVVGRECGQGQCRCDRLLALTRVAKSTHQAMMRVVMGRLRREGVAEDCGGFCGMSCRKQVHGSLCKCVGVVRACLGHISL